MSQRDKDNATEQPERDNREEAIISADDTGMVSGEADRTNAEIIEAIGKPAREIRPA